MTQNHTLLVVGTNHSRDIPRSLHLEIAGEIISTIERKGQVIFVQTEAIPEPYPELFALMNELCPTTHSVIMREGSDAAEPVITLCEQLGFSCDFRICGQYVEGEIERIWISLIRTYQKQAVRVARACQFQQD
jgi:hypothetical protein